MIAALRGERVAGAGVGSVRARLALGLVAVAAPAAQVHLEDVERLGEHVAVAALLEVVAVLPGIPVEVEGARRGARDLLGIEAVRVGLVELAAVGALDEVLVERALLDAGHKALPDAARLGLLERGGRLVPAVEVADDVNAPHVRGPDGKVVAMGAVLCDGGMRAHLLVAPVPLATSEEEQVIVAQVESAVGRFHVTLLEGLCTGQHSLWAFRQRNVHEKAASARNRAARRATAWEPSSMTRGARRGPPTPMGADGPQMDVLLARNVYLRPVARGRARLERRRQRTTGCSWTFSSSKRPSAARRERDGVSPSKGGRACDA